MLLFCVKFGEKKILSLRNLVQQINFFIKFLLFCIKFEVIIKKKKIFFQHRKDIQIQASKAIFKS